MNCQLPRPDTRRNLITRRAQIAYLARGSVRSLATSGSKQPEQALPAHGTWMNKGIRVGKKSFANLAGLPGILPDRQRHVNHDRRANDVISRDAAPEAAVKRIEAVVAHHKIALVRNFEGKLLLARFAAPERVIFAESLAVDPDSAVMYVDRVAGQTDDALHVVRLIGRERWLEDDDLLAFGIAPERDVPVGEGHASVVADAAHDEVVADEKSVFHRAGRNDAGLADGAVDEEKREAHPEPGD